MNKKTKINASKNAAASDKVRSQHSEDSKLKAKKAAKAVDTGNMASGQKKI